MESGSDQPQLPRGLIGRRGTPSGKGTRLPSIRGPRDLTLGGIPKKVFTPNIPTRRDKSKESSEPEQSTSGEGKKSRHGPSDHGRDGRGRGRGRGRGNANIIQSHSIFEQGPTEKSRRSASGYEPGMRNEGGGGGGGSKMSMKKERGDTMTKEVLDHLLRDDFIAHGQDMDDDVTLIPVKLPLQIKTETATTVKTEEPDFTKMKVKSEPMEVEGGIAGKPPVAQDDKKTVLNVKSEARPITCTDLFSDPAKSESGQLMFLQLPDALPGLPPSTDDDFKRKPDKDKPDESLEKKMSGCNLDDFTEGLVGKIIVRKSGRVQMLLGNTLLDVTMGTPCGFLQDLVSVHTDGEGGDISVLGHIDHRLVCTPDFEALLNTS